MKQTNNKKQKNMAKPSCANCFACLKGTVFCALSPNFDREKAHEILEARIREAKARD